MKSCPRCHATLFDDMAICYGCMFRFEPEVDFDEDFLGVVDDAVLHRTDGIEVVASGAASMTKTPEASIAPGSRLDLSTGPAALSEEACPQAGDWLVRLELKNIENPQQVWSMELTPSCWGSLVVA